MRRTVGRWSQTAPPIACGTESQKTRNNTEITEKEPTPSLRVIRASSM